MNEALRYAVVFERSEEGYGVFVPDLPGCVSVGDTIEEAQRSIREAIQGHLSVMREFGDPIPVPTTLTQYVEVPAPMQKAS